MDAGVEVKVKDYDGTYVCLFCGESVQGQPALKCSHCSSNVASPRLLSGVAVVMQSPMPTFTRVLEQHENGEQAPRRRVAGLFIVS